MARLERKTFFKLVAGQFNLVLIVINAGAVVIEDSGTGGVELERAAELGQRFLIHAVAAQREAGHHVHVPVVGRARKQVGDAVASRLLFAAREQHVNAVEIGLGGRGIEPERLVEGATRAHHVNLAAETVAHILQLGDAEAAPSGREFRVGRGDARKQGMGAVKIGARAGAHHERTEQRATLQIAFADGAGQRALAR